MDILAVLVITTVAAICEARMISYPREARLSLAQQPMPYYFHNNIDGHPGTYSYGYDVADSATGNNQYRTEDRYPNGTVVGSYGYVDAWGRPQRYKYVADERGYRVMRDPIYQPVQMAAPIYHPVMQPSESSITWTRPKKSNKNKYNNYVNRPQYNLIGPPSLYAED